MNGATASETERSTPETVQAGERVAELLVIPQGMHHPNAIGELRATVVIPFVSTSKPYRPRRRRKAT